MQRHREQWKGVNGTWADYRKVHDGILFHERSLDELLREKFNEQQQPINRRRRTLDTDITDTKTALELLRIKERGYSANDPELAARILDSKLHERHREYYHTPDRFMWFDSFRRIRSELGEHIVRRRSLRLILLEGEAGSGKTTLARVLSRLFTGTLFLKAVGNDRMKVDRALFADEKPGGEFSTDYKPLLYALTGKKHPAQKKPDHEGRAFFLDEANALANDEMRVLATHLDSARPGQSTEYSLMGADPKDAILPKAIVFAAQNPPGQDFPDRTVFTPEVERKITKKQIPFLEQTPENPELYLSFLIALQDDARSIYANKDELEPPFQDVTKKDLETGTEYIQQECDTSDKKKGGALWRFAQMLADAYRSRDHYQRLHPNTLTTLITDANPDIRLSGSVLTPGDVYEWLEEYRSSRGLHESLASFLSHKFYDWTAQTFTGAQDSENRELYSQLAESYGLCTKSSGGVYEPLPSAKTSFRILTHKDVASLSPSIPRKKIFEKGAPQKPVEAPPEFKAFIEDATDTVGREYIGLQFRGEELLDRHTIVFRNDPSGVHYRIYASIRECDTAPQLIGLSVYKAIDHPEQKRIGALPDVEFIKGEAVIEVVSPRGKKEIINPLADIWKEQITDDLTKLEKDRLLTLAEIKIEKFEIDPGEMLDICKQVYRRKGLATWADTLPGDVSEVISSNPGQLKRFESYLKAGKIPFFMPPAEVQLETMKTMMTGDRFAHFKPDITATDNTGATSTRESDNGYVSWEHFRNLTASKNRTLVSGIPDCWYIAWFAPTQKPEATKKTLDQQKHYIKKAQVDFKREHNTSESLIDGIMPAEYFGLQTALPDIVKAQMQKESVQFKSYIPLDKGTWTRFPGVEEADGFVAVAHWDVEDRRLRLSGSVGLAGGDVGFRLLVREKIKIKI